VQLQNSNLKFGIMSISYMQSNFQEKQHINGQDPAQQVCKIWRKNFRELLRNHIFGVGSFFKAAPCRTRRRDQLALRLTAAKRLDQRDFLITDFTSLYSS